jgi:hypothetical protein
MHRRINIKLLTARDGSPLTLLERVKVIVVGVLVALSIATLLFVALILGSLIAAIIGLLIIVAVVIIVVRGAILQSRRQ